MLTLAHAPCHFIPFHSIFFVSFSTHFGVFFSRPVVVVVVAVDWDFFLRWGGGRRRRLPWFQRPCWVFPVMSDTSCADRLHRNQRPGNYFNDLICVVVAGGGGQRLRSGSTVARLDFSALTSRPQRLPPLSFNVAISSPFLPLSPPPPPLAGMLQNHFEHLGPESPAGGRRILKCRAPAGVCWRRVERSFAYLNILKGKWPPAK